VRLPEMIGYLLNPIFTTPGQDRYCTLWHPGAVHPLVPPSHCNDEKNCGHSGSADTRCTQHSMGVVIRAVVVKTDKSLALIAHQIVAMAPRWSSTSRTGYRTARTRPSGACGQNQCHNHECYNPAAHFWPHCEFFRSLASYLASYIAAGRKYSVILRSIGRSRRRMARRGTISSR
jgi:hypothetical protein